MSTYIVQDFPIPESALSTGEGMDKFVLDTIAALGTGAI